MHIIGRVLAHTFYLYIGGEGLSGDSCVKNVPSNEDAVNAEKRLRDKAHSESDKRITARGAPQGEAPLAAREGCRSKTGSTCIDSTPKRTVGFRNL